MSRAADAYKNVVARPYPPGGCQVPQGKEKCGETIGLDIITDFHKLYEEKMSQIDVSAGGDSLQEKVDLQQDWINDLTEQNKMLAKVIQELEKEAINRVQQLEDKLKNAVKSLGEDENKQSPTLTETDDKRKLEEHHQEELKEETPPVPEKQSEEDYNFKEVDKKHDAISLMRKEFYREKEKNNEILREVSIKDDIIKELRKELKRTKHKFETKMKKIDRASNTEESNMPKINHSTISEAANNSKIIFIHNKGQNKEEFCDPRALFDSSDSSECGLNESMSLVEDNKGQLHCCKSENDMKEINWMKPTKERSKFTKISKNQAETSEMTLSENSNRKKLVIPKHIPVKTYVNNIEFVKDSK